MERANSDESLDNRLHAAALNSKLNENPNVTPNLNRFLKYVKPAQTDGLDSRSFLKTSEDEDESLIDARRSPVPALLLRHTDKDKTDKERAQEQGEAPPPTQPDHSPLSADMDRKLRQNKPRLLLMGQRRYPILKPPPLTRKVTDQEQKREVLHY